LKIGLLNLQYKSKLEFLIRPTTRHNGQNHAMLLTFTNLESWKDACQFKCTCPRP